MEREFHVQQVDFQLGIVGQGRRQAAQVLHDFQGGKPCQYLDMRRHISKFGRVPLLSQLILKGLQLRGVIGICPGPSRVATEAGGLMRQHSGADCSAMAVQAAPGIWRY